MNILIADDHGIVRDGLKLLFESDPDQQFAVVGEAETGAETLRQIVALAPDVVLLDLRMPELGGFAVLEALQDTADAPPVIVLTMHDDLAFVRKAIQLGARGYLLKSVDRDELFRAVQAVRAGRPYVQGSLTRPLFESFAEEAGGASSVDLSARQRDILEELAGGRDNREIGSTLALSESTVKAELRAIYDVLGVTNRSEAVAVAFRLGMLT